MQTINKEIIIKGKGLMTGQEAIVTLVPSEEKGIRFYMPNCPAPVIADPQSVVSTENCVVLANAEGAKVMLTEHFMAACAFAGIDSIDVKLNGFEMPILDGSALEWYRVLPKNKITEIIEFNNPIVIENIILAPADELKITYCINFDHPDLKNRWYTFDNSQNTEQIIGARTFGYLKDLEKFQQMGMALGVSIDNTVGLTEDGYTTELRSEFEPIKHKILDLIGDLYLTGHNPLSFKAHIIAKDAGHKFHVDFARLLQSSQ